MPLRLEANSWVTIQLSEKGGHAQDARRHSGTSLTWVYKARVLKFKAGRGSSNAYQILVQHAYMHRQLQLDPWALAIEATIM